MENQNEKDVKDGKGCCDKSKCCGGKALAAFALLAIGGAGGYVAGKGGAATAAAPAAVAARALAKYAVLTTRAPGSSGGARSSRI